MSDIVVFGATGYTGDLTARALVEQGARPVLAARNPDRLQALASELGGLETRVADVADPVSVHALVKQGDVLVSTVGPFNRWGDPAVEAAIAGGAHYLDSTGESGFIRKVFEQYGPRAQSAGVGLLTAFGYDWVPGNLAGALALREAGDDAVRVEVGYFMTGRAGAGSMSGGTRASAAGVMLDPSFAFRKAQLRSERTASRVRSFPLKPGRDGLAVSAGGSEHFALPRQSRYVRDVDVYLGWFGPASRPLQALSAGNALLTRVPGVRAGMKAALGKVVKGSTGGPDAAARSTSGSLVFGEAFAADGTLLSHVRLEGVNGYDFTARILAWGARTALAGGLQDVGALGPADGFGLDALEAGAAEAGIERA